MTTEPMSFRRFSELLDTLGATLPTWPAEDRQAAERLLKASPQAIARLAEAQTLDDAMRQAQPRAPAGLVDRIMQASEAEPTPPAKSKPAGD